MAKYLSILKNCLLLEGFVPQELSLLLERMDAAQVRLKKGEVLFREGEELRWVAIVLEGFLQVYREDSSGKRTLMFGREAGDLLGEACLFAGVRALPACALAPRESRVLLLSGERLLACGMEGDALSRRLMWNLARCVAQKNLLLNRKIYILTRRTTREKLMAFLSEQAERSGSPEFVIPYDRQALADYLAVDRSAMSVELGKLRAEGKIACEGSYFRILEAYG